MGRNSNLTEGLDYNLENETIDTNNYVQIRNQKLIEAYKIVEQNLQSSQNQYKKYFDKRVQHQNFEVADIVYYFAGKMKQNKYTPISKCLNPQKWLGPFSITDIYGASVKLFNIKTNKLLPKPINIRRLKKGYIKNGRYSMKK